MENDQFFKIGHISRVHGNDGKVYVHLDVDDPEPYLELESVFLDLENKPVPFFVEYTRFTPNGLLVKFEDIDDREEASRFVGAGLMLPLDALPELSDGKFYFHELIGTTLMDQHDQEIGKVDLIYDQTSQILLGVIRNGREILIPMADEFKPDLNRENRILRMKIPDGLLDIYDEEP